MKRLSFPDRRWAAVWVVLLLVASGAVRLEAATSTAKKGAKPPTGKPAATSAASAPGTPAQSGQTRALLTDQDLLGSVDDRKITVYDFRDRYWSSFHSFRPSQDSAGRVQFLNSLVEKEILGLTALKAGRPLDFNDRATLREVSNTALANTFFDRTIADSVRVSEDEILAVYEQYKWETHFRHILFADRPTATAVRKDLVAKKITWADAVKKYSRAVDDVGADGDMGWIKRALLKDDFAIQIFNLKMNEISQPVVNAEGVHLVQALERTPKEPLALAGLRSLIRAQIRGQRTQARLRDLHNRIARENKIVYDTTNIRWLSDTYWQSKKVVARSKDAETPDPVATMSGEDLKRVLVRSPERQLNLGEFFDQYRALPPLARTQLYSFESVHLLLRNLFVEPYIVKLAVARGFENDPNVILVTERKREQILVEHMYQDSVLARMSIQPQQRKKYYEQNKSQFVSNPKVEYADYILENEAAAKALVAKLAGGAGARSLAKPDKALGVVDGAVHEAYQEQGKPYDQVLFDELKPGKSIQEGPDSQGRYKVTHEIAYYPQRQLSYTEVEGIVDESVQNIEAERRLKELIARHRGKYRVVSHPERVMHFALTDPINDLKD